MSDKLSAAAERVVIALSRRSFLAWAGGAGAALAAGLGLDRLRSPAFAKGVACKKVVLARHVGFTARDVAACVPRGQCGSRETGTKRAIVDEACFRSFANECDEKGEHCRVEEKCRPVFGGDVTAVRLIHCSAQEDDRCPGDVLCTCEAAVFPDFKCDCKCCLERAPRRPGQECVQQP